MASLRVIVAAAVSSTALLLSGCGSDSVDGTPGMEPHPVEVTAEGFVLGDPAAEDSVVIYEDFNCPHCVDLHAQLEEKDAVDTWISQGATVEVVPVNYLGPRTTHNFSGVAANALTLVAERYPDHFGAAQAALFEIRPDSTTDELAEGAVEQALRDAGIELTEQDVTDLNELAYEDWVNTATESAAANGVNYIPQVWVNGELVEEDNPGKLVDSINFD